MKTQKDKVENFIRVAGDANHDIEIPVCFWEG
jgi:hypothetical protein